MAFWDDLTQEGELRVAPKPPPHLQPEGVTFGSQVGSEGDEG